MSIDNMLTLRQRAFQWGSFPFLDLLPELREFVYHHALATQVDGQPPHMLHVLRTRKGLKAADEYKHALGIYHKVNASIVDTRTMYNVWDFQALGLKELRWLRHLYFDLDDVLRQSRNTDQKLSLNNLLRGHVSTCKNSLETITVRMDRGSGSSILRSLESCFDLGMVGWLINASTKVSTFIFKIDWDSAQALERDNTQSKLNEAENRLNNALGFLGVAEISRSSITLTWDSGLKRGLKYTECTTKYETAMNIKWY